MCHLKVDHHHPRPFGACKSKFTLQENCPSGCDLAPNISKNMSYIVYIYICIFFCIAAQCNLNTKRLSMESIHSLESRAVRSPMQRLQVLALVLDECAVPKCPNYIVSDLRF